MKKKISNKIDLYHEPIDHKIKMTVNEGKKNLKFLKLFSQ